MSAVGVKVVTPVPGTREAFAAGDQASRLRALVETPRHAVHGGAVGAARAEAPPLRRAARGAKVITVSSGKGGVGKTNVAVNLSISLAALGHRVTLLDADLGTANADVLCGMLPGARLDEVVRSGWGGRSMRDIAVQAPGGFTLVPGTAGIARMADLSPSQRQRLVDAVTELETGADVLVIDTAAGVGAAVTSFVRIADLAVVVTTPEPTAVADAYALIKCVAAGWRGDGGGAGVAGGGVASGGQERAPLALLVNQVADAGEAAGVHRRVAAVCDRFLGLPLGLAGHVAHDLRVVAAVRSRRPFALTHPKCEASRDMRQVAARLAQQVGVVQGGGEGREQASARRTGLFARLLGGHGSELSSEMFKKTH